MVREPLRPVRGTLAEHAAVWVDMAPHVGTLSRLVSDCRSVVELGLRGGVSTWAFLDGLPPDGRLVSVDLALRADVPSRVTGDPRWSFVEGDDRDPAIQRRLPPADAVFIDTSHEYDHTLAELWLADELGAPLVIVHDWNLPGVSRACRRFSPRGWVVEPSQWGMAWLRR